MEVSIRKAALQDAAQLASLLRSLGLFAVFAQEQPEQSQERVARHLALCLADDSHTVYVAEQPDGVLCGYLSLHWLPYLILPAPEGYVSELFIAEHARGLGLGGALLQAAEAEARRRGCARLMLLNMRRRESYQRGFYAKQGWQERSDAANFVRYVDESPNA